MAASARARGSTSSGAGVSHTRGAGLSGSWPGASAVAATLRPNGSIVPSPPSSPIVTSTQPTSPEEVMVGAAPGCDGGVTVTASASTHASAMNAPDGKRGMTMRLWGLHDSALAGMCGASTASAWQYTARSVAVRILATPTPAAPSVGRKHSGACAQPSSSGSSPSSSRLSSVIMPCTRSASVAAATSRSVSSTCLGGALMPNSPSRLSTSHATPYLSPNSALVAGAQPVYAAPASASSCWMRPVVPMSPRTSGTTSAPARAASRANWPRDMQRGGVGRLPASPPHSPPTPSRPARASSCWVSS
mmetsp:Transcript_25739/g.65442  ORF Transcript_25739/g.65442 Transcript_25739/m.65442 type:complete len:304 (+) Transcript_25739:623-1534(+)